MKPILIKGGLHKDNRGKLKYNNEFDMSDVKRIYIIENINSNLIRQWQGHKIQQRWFLVAEGKFKIVLIKIDNWKNPSKKLEKITFVISNKSADVLHVPKGYVTSIQSLSESSKLLVMSDYKLGLGNDNFKYSSDYFN